LPTAVEAGIDRVDRDERRRQLLELSHRSALSF
jgi:hypothetical protein